jgi:hypothetical protein
MRGWGNMFGRERRGLSRDLEVWRSLKWQGMLSLVLTNKEPQNSLECLPWMDPKLLAIFFEGK